MMTKVPFRRYHLIRLMKVYDFRVPFEHHIQKYFQMHSALGKKDREEIKENAFFLIKNWIKLHYLFPDHSLEDLIENAFTNLTDCNIPGWAMHSLPEPLYNHILTSLGKNSDVFFSFLRQKAPITLRCNAKKCRLEDLTGQLFPIKTSPSRKSPWTLYVEENKKLTHLSIYKKGWFEMQDLASQMVAQFVQPAQGETILDYCAGGGGKSLAIASMTPQPIKVVLHDIRKYKLQEALYRFKRAGLAQPEILLQKHHQCDWVIVDAPCSGSGTWRRHFTMALSFSLQQHHKTLSLQKSILEEAKKYLRTNGKLVYITCSVFPEENEMQIAWFCQKFHFQEIQRWSSFPHLLDDGGKCADGFFISILQQKYIGKNDLGVIHLS